MKLYSTLLFVFLFVAKLSFPQQVYLTRSGQADFISNAPLEIIRAGSKMVSGGINLSDRSFVFSIDNKSFVGFNSALQQEHFSENYLETQKYPFSTFKGKIIETIDTTSVIEQVVRAKGVLDIHGVGQERIIRGSLRINGAKIYLQAEFTIPLEDHEIKVPRVVYQKIAEVVDVKVRAELIRKEE